MRQGYYLDKVIEQIGHIVIITFCCENTIMKTYFLLNTYDNNDKKTMRIERNLQNIRSHSYDLQKTIFTLNYGAK